MALVNMLVEGTLDEEVARRILSHTQHTPGVCYGKRGYGYIKEKLPGFNQAAQSVCYLALVDFMDTGHNCPSEAVAQWLPNPRPRMIFRLVVRELESWLLADRDGLATFLHIRTAAISSNPEQLTDPKREIVNLARRSRSSAIRSAFVPENGSTAQVGRLYQSSMLDFIQTQWNISQARTAAPSLDRCILRLSGL